MSELVIRPITRNDIASCLDIYNYEVVNGVATLDLEPRTLSEWQGGEEGFLKKIKLFLQTIARTVYFSYNNSCISYTYHQS